MSMSEQIFLFGLGDKSKVDSVILRWSNGKSLSLEDPKINALIEVKEVDAKLFKFNQFNNSVEQVYTQEIKNENLNLIRHKESNYDDYKLESLMPHRMSTLGPAMEIADINNDGLDDFFLGGFVGFETKLFMQDEKGNFNLNKTIEL